MESDPNWAEVVTAIGTAVVALGVIAATVGAFMAKRAVDEDSKGRHAQIAMDLGRRWDSPETASIKQLTKKWDPLELRLYWEIKNHSNSDEYYELERFANFFEELGVLNKLKILKLDWIDETLGSAVLDYWEMWRSAIKLEQKTWPKAYENWTSLAQKIEARRSGPQ
jgi:hypothetical protein